MGFTEKIQEILARRKVSPVLRQATEVVNTTQIAYRQAESERRRVWTVAAEQEVARKTALNIELENLLKLVGAREQLEVIKRTWGVGKIDATVERIFDMNALVNCRPTRILDSSSMDTQFYQMCAEIKQMKERRAREDELSLPYGSLDDRQEGVGLALRYRFRDAERADIYQRHGLPLTTNGSYWSKRELALYTIVGFREDGLPFVTTLYRSCRLGDDTIYFMGGKSRFKGRSREPEIYCVDRCQPEEIFPGNSIKSAQVLRDQLYRIANEPQTSFLELERQARQRIVDDYNLPRRVRHQASAVWHERLSANIPVVNSLLR